MVCRSKNVHVGDRFEVLRNTESLRVGEVWTVVRPHLYVGDATCTRESDGTVKDWCVFSNVFRRI